MSGPILLDGARTVTVRTEDGATLAEAGRTEPLVDAIGRWASARISG